MQESDYVFLRDCVLACARDVFASCSIPAELHEGDVEELGALPHVVACIGFSGDKLRGMLTVVAPLLLMQAAYPREISLSPDEDQVLDWAGEVANQLLGRIKRRLVARGVTLGVSTPRALLADQLAVARSTRTSICVLRSSVGDSLIGVWFDAEPETDGILFEDPDPPPEAVADAGELILF